MDFIAIDFETANAKMTPCAVGLIVVENNIIVEEFYTLINPRQPFDHYNVKIHGITESDVKKSPSFANVWEKIEGYFRRYPCVAHNAGYDKKVLELALQRYRLYNDTPTVYYCTMALYCHNYPDAQSSDLASVCAALNVPLENHHNALLDARATAQIMVSLYANNENAIFPSFVSGLYLYTQEQEEANLVKSLERAQEARPRSFFAGGTTEFAETTALMDETTEITFNDSVFVLTGKIGDFERPQLEALIVKRGGVVATGVSKKVNYVVVGLQDISVVADADGAKSLKIIKAEALRDKGHDIKIVDASTFLAAIQKDGEI